MADLAPVGTRSGPGWFAIRSGAQSNDLNVVVSAAGVVPSSQLVESLMAWFDGLPASWLTKEPAEPLTRALIASGAIPERSGRWCGRALRTTGRSAPDEVAITAVSSDLDLENWLETAMSCGWFQNPADQAIRRSLLMAKLGDRRSGAWVGTLLGRPVGMVSGWCDGDAVEVVDVAVRADARRHGVGTALVSQVITWAVERGVREVVAAPSSDGWRLFESLDFANVPVVPDTCFYLPG